MCLTGQCKTQAACTIPKDCCTNDVRQRRHHFFTNIVVQASQAGLRYQELLLSFEKKFVEPMEQESVQALLQAAREREAQSLTW